MFLSRTSLTESKAEKSKHDLENLEKERKKYIAAKKAVDDTAKKYWELQFQLKESEETLKTKWAELDNVEKEFGNTSKINFWFMKKKEIHTLTILHTPLTPTDENIASGDYVIRAAPPIPDDFPLRDKENITSLINLLFLLKLKFDLNSVCDYHILQNQKIKINPFYPKYYRKIEQMVAVKYFKEQGCEIDGEMRDSIAIIIPMEKLAKAVQDLKAISCTMTEEDKKTFSTLRY